MKHFLAVLLFAVIAGLVSCEVASKDGIRGIPATWRSFMGGSGGAPMVAKFEAAAIDAADVKAKVADVVADAKAKVAEVAEKAVEAAQPDRSDAVAPAPAEAMPEPAPVAEAAPAEAAVPVEAQVAAPPVEPAVEAAVEPAAPASVEDAAPVSLGGVGQTSFFGIAEKADAGQPWAAEATMSTEQVAQAPVDETPSSEAPAAVPAAAEPAASAEAVEPSADEAPVSLGGVGQTSYFGLADKPDSDQPWAASAAMNADDSADAPAPEAAPDAAQATEPAATTEAAAPATEEAPASSPSGAGQTSFFGLASMPDADRPWAAEAAMNPDYTADAAIAEAPAAEPAAEAAAPVDEPAPVPLGGVGQTSYNGISEKADSTQPWAAGATMNPNYSAEVQAAAPAAAPATSEAIENCRDALNAEAQAGGLNFELTRWDITPDEYGALDRIAKLAKDCGGVMIEVGGHADETGRRASNKTLSELRAKAVVNYLIKAGVDASKLKAVGYGQDKPIGDNATAEGRRKNRRIEFLVTGS